MLLLLIRRFELNNFKKNFRSFLTLVFIFTVFYAFSLLLIMIYENKISQYNESSYDYMLTNFDEENIENIKSQIFVEGTYATRLVNSTLHNGSKEELILLNLVDEWDKNNISYMGLNRSAKGDFNNTQENSIVLDILTARKINVGIGDTVDLYFKDIKCTYKIAMLLEPDASSGEGLGVCLYNSYFCDAWGKAFPTMPPYSLLYVNTNDDSKADEYFYNEFVGPRMGEKAHEDIVKANENSNIKKLWNIEEAKRDLKFTPSVTVIISILGIIALFIFILRETSSKMNILNKDLAILSTIGMKLSHMTRYFLISCCGVQIPAILVSSVIVKKIIYDLLISNYYLPWRLIGYANLITIVFSFFAALIVSIGVCVKFKKSSICKILAAE